MSEIFVHGCGAVSPLGWGMESLRNGLNSSTPVESSDLERPGWTHPLKIRRVPAPTTRPGFLAHARLRRTSPITQYAVFAALEALGGDVDAVSNKSLRLGIISCMMSGCVNYSRRFFDEALRDPATASPLVFPETVFNAPASHIAALLGTPSMNYTLVGDPGTLLQGIALAASWLAEDKIDGCIVIGAEEADWMTADAFHLFDRRIVLGDGSGAIYLKRASSPAPLAQLVTITSPYLYCNKLTRFDAAKKVRENLPLSSDASLLCDGIQNTPALDGPELEAWKDWKGSRQSPKKTLGEGLMAAAAWQTLLAIDALKQNGYTTSNVSVVGCNQQAIGARFARVDI